MFPRIRVEFDTDEESHTQFLRDSFVEGFKCADKDKFIAAFDKIKDKVPQTEDDDATRYSAGDEFEAIANRPKAHPTHQ